MTGRVDHVCLSRRKGRAKTPVREAELIKNHGLAGDAHAGPEHRQVSLLDVADIDRMRRTGLELAPGAFGENLGVAGIDLDDVGIGSVLAIDDARLEITQIGKTCHRPCAISVSTGDCIMPRAGLFARVLAGGTVRAGSAITVLNRVSRTLPQAAVVTVSDRCAQGEADDTSGPAVCRMVRESLGAHIAWTEVLPDEADQLADRLAALCDHGLDLLITTGGTGFGRRDHTPEATSRVIEREAPGLAEEMRRRSADITPHALLQRGVCGIRGRTLILNLPGSEKGATENLSFVLPALPHAIKLLRDEPVHTAQDEARRRARDAATPIPRAEETR